MPRLVSLILVLLLAAFSLPVRAGSADNTLRIGYFVLPPHVGGRGQAVEDAPAYAYFRRLMPAMGVSAATINDYPLPRLLQMLDRGELDMALLMAHSPERGARFVYPRQPFFVTRPVLALRQDARLKRIDGVRSLLPLSIGVWKDGFLSPMLRDPRLQLVRISGDFVADRNLRMIELGHVDAFYSPDRCAVQHAMARAKGRAHLQVLNLPEAGVPLYSVFSRQAAPRWLGRYEAALAEQQKRQGYADTVGQCG